MGKPSFIDDLIILSSEEFQVYEALQKISSEIETFKSVTVDGKTFVWGIYLPQGIRQLELIGKTAVYTMKYLSYSSVKYIEQVYQDIGKEYNVLVVYQSSSISPIPSLNKSLDHLLMYKSLKDLRRSRRYNERSYYTNKTKLDWKDVRENTIERACTAVKQMNNVLFLGAGVSMSAEMPSWSQLLANLMGEVKQLKPSTLEAFKEMQSHIYEECGDSNLIMARYLETAIKFGGNKNEFTQLIQNYLYSSPHTSKLLEKLALTILQNKVCEVITYNFDNILEQELIKRGLDDSVQFTSIAKDAEIKGHNTLPIYHVHGIIPENGPTDVVVFSEEEYHKRYSDIYHWSNVEQLHALSRQHCFFIGLSMTDPNLRRLLDTARRMNLTNGDCHFAFLQRTKIEHYCVSDKPCKYVHISESLIDDRKQKEIYDLNYSIIEHIFNDLGVQIIWFEDYDELPSLISRVFTLNVDSSNVEGMIDNIKENITKISEVELNSLYSKDYSTSALLSIQKSCVNYENLVQRTGDILIVLTSQIMENLDDKEIKQALKLYLNLLNSKAVIGYANFYRNWLESITNLKSSKGRQDINFCQNT